MITVEEFLQEHPVISHYYDDEFDWEVVPILQVQQAMIEFAKLHVEAAKKEYHKVLVKQGVVTDTGIGYFDNAYPLENIK